MRSGSNNSDGVRPTGLLSSSRTNATSGVRELLPYLEALYYSTSLVVDTIRRHAAARSATTSSSSSSSSRAIRANCNSTSANNSSRHCSSSTQTTTQDAALGTVVELVTSLSVACALNAFEALVWQRVVSNTMTRECQRYESKHKVRRVAVSRHTV